MKSKTNWEKLRKMTDKEIEMLEEYVPSGYESSCHSIESITVYEINSKKVYL